MYFTDNFLSGLKIQQGFRPFNLQYPFRIKCRDCTLLAVNQKK